MSTAAPSLTTRAARAAASPRALPWSRWDALALLALAALVLVLLAPVLAGRADLPAGDFEFWVDDHDPPACCLSNVTRANGDQLRGGSPDTTLPVAAPPSTVTVAVAIAAARRILADGVGASAGSCAWARSDPVPPSAANGGAGVGGVAAHAAAVVGRLDVGCRRGRRGCGPSAG